MLCGNLRSNLFYLLYDRLSLLLHSVILFFDTAPLPVDFVRLQNILKNGRIVINGKLKQTMNRLIET